MINIHGPVCCYVRRLLVCGIGVLTNILYSVYLGARDDKQARRGTIFAGFLKLTPVFLFIIPGMICFALAKSGINPDIQQRID